MIRFCTLVLTVSFALCLCACGAGYREINSEYLVSAIGFDNENGSFRVYAQVLAISEEKKDSECKLFEGVGKTPYEAVANIDSQLPKKAVFDHCSTALIGESIAGKRFKTVMEYLYDTKNLNLGISLYATRDIKEVLSSDSQALSSGYDIMAIKSNIENSTGIGFKNRYYEICALQIKNGGFCLPAVSVNDNRPEISGQYVYVDFSNVFELSRGETVVYNLLRGGSSGGELSVSGKRLRINGIKVNIENKEGVISARIHCNYRQKSDELGGAIKAETEKLLKKIQNTPAVIPLGIEQNEKGKNPRVSVYG